MNIQSIPMKIPFLVDEHPINTYENTIFSGMNIHFIPAILMWTTGVQLVLLPTLPMSKATWLTTISAPKPCESTAGWVDCYSSPMGKKMAQKISKFRWFMAIKTYETFKGGHKNLWKKN